MVMTVLARMDGQNTDGGSVWYERGVAWAKEKGISDGTNPEGSVTREQLAVMLYRYAGEPAMDKMDSLSSFSDRSKASGYAEQALQWAVKNGIMGGNSDGTLNPDGNATRAEVAAMLMRFQEARTK